MESLNRLKQTLINMVDVHHQLLQLAEEKRTLLVEGKVVELQIMLGKESKYTDIIRNLEVQRELQVQQFMTEMGYKSGPFTMGQVIQFVNNPQDQYNLSMLTEKLRGIVHDVSQLNKHNQHLIQMTLSYIQYSINILMPKEQTIGYGKKSAAASVKFLDAKI